MDRKHRDALLLIRSAIKKEKVALPSDFDFNNVVELAHSQRLLAVILYNGAILSGFKIGSVEMCSLLNIVSDRLQMRAEQMREYESMVSAFEALGLSYMPIKGSFIKDYYPNPQMRLMEDLDLMIREEEYPKIKGAMSGLGFRGSPYADNHFVWEKGIVSIELHRMLLSSTDHYTKIYYSKRNEWEHAIKKEGSSRHEMRAEDHYVFLLVHLAKHYRHGSISLKSIIDLYVFKSVFPNMDWEYIESVLKKLSLLKFSATVDRLLEVWFENRESDEATDSMTDVIFKTGIYDMDGSLFAASIIREGRSNLSSRRNSARWLMKTVFPPAKSLELLFPILKKHRAMLPLCWVLKWIDVLFGRPERIRAKLKIIKSAAKDSELVERYKKQLDIVGLEFIMPTEEDLE